MAGDDRPQLPLGAVEGVFHLLAGDAQGQGAAAVDGLAPGHDGEPGAEAPAPGGKFVRVLPEVDEDVGDALLHILVGPDAPQHRAGDGPHEPGVSGDDAGNGPLVSPLYGAYDGFVPQRGSPPAA